MPRQPVGGHAVCGLYVGEGSLRSVGGFADSAEQLRESLLVASGLRADVVPANRQPSSAAPAEVLGFEVPVRDAQTGQLAAQGFECRRKPFFRLRGERFAEREALREPLQDEVRAVFSAGRVFVAHLVAQEPVFGEPLRAERAEPCGRPLDAGHGGGREGHADEPSSAPPVDLGFGEARSAAHPRPPVRPGRDACVAQCVEVVGGCEQRPREAVYRGCHAFIPFLR